MSAYAWWQSAKANPGLIGETLLIHDGDPQPGFYVVKSRRVWTKGVPRVTDPEPVAIWPGSDGEMLAVIGVREWRRSVRADDIWTWCAATPISETLYRHVA